jgi:hypothetical protein
MTAAERHPRPVPPPPAGEGYGLEEVVHRPKVGRMAP